MGMIEWDKVEPAKRSSGGNGRVIYVSGKNCPLTIIPIKQVLEFDDSYQGKARKRYLFVAADRTGDINVYCCGPQVLEQVSSQLKAARKLGRNLAAVEITASGSGKDTQYTASIDGDLTQSITKEFFKLPASGLPNLEQVLEEMRARQANAPATQTKADPAPAAATTPTATATDLLDSIG